MSSIFDAPAELDPFGLNAEVPMSILSPSSIACYMRCPEQFRREYVRREERAPGAWGLAGSAFHDARHEALTFAMERGRPMHEAELLQAYRRAWDKRLAKEGANVRWSEKDTPASMKERGWGMTSQYHQELGQTVKPVRMEYGVKGFVSGVPVPVYGRIDVETAEEVIDTKTGKNLTHKIKPEWYVQGCIYVLLVGKPMRWHSVSQKPAATTNESLRLVPRPKVLMAAERYVRLAYAGIVRHLREVGPDGEWDGTGPVAGSCTYCSFRGTCAFVPD